jgi:hypothetical protein
MSLQKKEAVNISPDQIITLIIIQTQVETLIMKDTEITTVHMEILVEATVVVEMAVEVEEETRILDLPVWYDLSPYESLLNQGK